MKLNRSFFLRPFSLACASLAWLAAGSAAAFPVSGTYEAQPGGFVGAEPLQGPGTLIVDELAGTATFESPTIAEPGFDAGPPLVFFSTPVPLTGTFTDPSTLDLDDVCIVISAPLEPTVAVVGDWTLSFSDPQSFEWSGTTTYYSDAQCTVSVATLITSDAFMSIASPVPVAGRLGTLLLGLALASIGAATLGRVRRAPARPR